MSIFYTSVSKFANDCCSQHVHPIVKGVHGTDRLRVQPAENVSLATIWQLTEVALVSIIYVNKISYVLSNMVSVSVQSFSYGPYNNFIV